MKNYLKLVNFEINRFLKLYIALAVITVLIQFAVIIYHAQKYLGKAKETLAGGSMTREAYVNDVGRMNLTYAMDGFFEISIVICIAVLLVYCFMIWYRDWFGKNTFIYRLLMLPTERVNIYFAKATAIFLMVLGLVAFQLALLPVEGKLLQLMVPIDFRTDLPLDIVMQGFNELQILFPTTPMNFMIHYGIGFMLVFILFTSILIERCYRLKGIFFGIIYFAFALAIFLVPQIIAGYANNSFLYPIEYFFMQVCLGLLITAMSILLSHYLLKKKIRV